MTRRHLRKMRLGDLRGTDGSALIEVAASLMVVLLTVLGVMDCSRLLYADLYVGYVARECARYAMVRGSSWTGTSCTDAVDEGCTASSAAVARHANRYTLPGIDAGALEVTTTWPGTNPSGAACNASSGSNSPGCLVQVRSVYSFRFAVPLLPQGAVRLASSSQVTISY